MIHFLYGAGQVAVGAALAWVLVTLFFESLDWFNERWQKIRLHAWKRRHPK